MKLITEDLSKKYNKQWIFKHFSCSWQTGEIIAITGHNGSGKSTLMKILAGFVAPTSGRLTYDPKSDHIQTKFGFVAPYLNLMEEFTLLEHLQFHARFKKPLISLTDMIKHCGLDGSENKLIKEFSSGMKQRLRLILAFYFENEIIFLDEPTSNMDSSGGAWFQSLIKSQQQNRLIIIASNVPEEYTLASTIINIENHKSRK